eukprot:CAMPEP_0196595346 /NCGR_PEP_ID=MMETSP1081-20130531/80886_1 /TAXON_ID=36882 /ORGANISM="Pyramimonas amylifera, Strain CCMP720" /LENGTH=59 /DNA_ID=CAMNT_0041919887 /DNA_START=44 /DNA_END=220 /DNA_ORIENTATION=+
MTELRKDLKQAQEEGKMARFGLTASDGDRTRSESALGGVTERIGKRVLLPPLHQGRQGA